MTKRVLVLSLAVSLLVSSALVQTSRADGYYCISKDLCISNQSYGKGIYHAFAEGKFTLLKISCDPATVDVIVDGEQWVGPAQIVPHTVASVLYEQTCGRALGEQS